MGNRTGPDPGGLPNSRKRHENKGRAGEQARPLAFVPDVGGFMGAGRTTPRQNNLLRPGAWAIRPLAVWRCSWRSPSRPRFRPPSAVL